VRRPRPRRWNRITVSEPSDMTTTLVRTRTRRGCQPMVAPGGYQVTSISTNVVGSVSVKTAG
jgi:hypothetical protein